MIRRTARLLLVRCRDSCEPTRTPSSGVMRSRADAPRVFAGTWRPTLPYGRTAAAGSGASSLQTSDRIADCAITVIARDGLDALSIRRVAAEAGVAIGTVQHHYPTRAELVLAALQRTAYRQQVRAMAACPGRSLIATLIARL